MITQFLTRAHPNPTSAQPCPHLQQGLSQTDAHLPTARERGHEPIQVLHLKTQLRRHLQGAAAERLLRQEERSGLMSQSARAPEEPRACSIFLPIVSSFRSDVAAASAVSSSAGA